MRPSILLKPLAFALLAPFASSQTILPDTKIQLVDPQGSPLPKDFFIIRDAAGIEIAPSQDPDSNWAFSNVGRKVTFEFTPKGLKVPGLELVLEDAPVVYVKMTVDPLTGKIKEVKQKAQRNRTSPKNKVGRPGTGQRGLTFVPPGNDACEDALPIFDGLTGFSTVDATTDGAPDPMGQYDGQTYEDIWYVYTPTCNGTLTVSTCNTANYDTDLAIYEADADGDGDHDMADCALITSGAELPLVSNDDSGICTLFTSVAATTIVADRQYVIRVGGGFPGDEGTGTLLVSCGGAPSNDICTAPRELTCGSSLEVTNVAATTAGGDPAFACAFGGAAQGDGTLWFSFVATSESAFLSTSNSTGVADSLLAVYSGSCNNLTELACDDDSGPGLLSELCVTGLTIGQRYLVQVASFPGADLGRLTIDLECPGPCAVTCDDIAAACPVPCGSEITVDNSNASTDGLDPLFSCAFGGPAQGVGTLWFTFLATATSARIDTNSSLAFDTLLAVYSGTPGALTELACSDDEGDGLLSELCVEGLTVGETYYIQAASFGLFDTGEITVALSCPCAEGFPNDECEMAIALDPLPASVTVDLTGATDDIAIPCGVFSGPFQNVWYSVTGTGNTLTATTCNAGTLVSDTKISIFCGDCMMPVCITGNDDDCDAGGPIFSSTVSWCSQAGATYFITVGTFSAFTTPGVVQLDVSDTGMSCMADIQCLPQGACCLDDGSCTTTTAVDCAAQGGTYQGDGTVCSSEFVADGSFEAGMFGGVWTESSTFFGTPLCDAICGFGGGTGPRTGNFWCWFGGIAAPETGSVEQAVTIPVNATNLDFYLEIPTSSGNGVDFMRVQIDGTTVFEVFEDDAVHMGLGYDLVSVPLAGFNDGGVHTLRFESSITGTGPGGAALTNFFVDDLSISSVTFDCEECFTLDFETEDDFSTLLVNGQKIDTEFGNLVQIASAGANAGAGIFESSTGGDNDPSQDRDLLVNRGNLLILQNSQVPATVGGIFTQPNDDQDGGDLIFDLLTPSMAMSVVLVDIDVGSNQASSVTLTDMNGLTRTYMVPGRWTEDLLINGPTAWRTLDLTTLAPQPGFASVATASEMEGFDASQVVRIKVHLGSSGAVDDLTFCH